MKIEQFQVRKDSLAESRLTTVSTPALAEGEILAKIDRFAITANNITYGVVGEQIGYWRFFPAQESWGIIPVWGFADVVESRHPEVAIGERLYGFFPMATHLIMSPDRLADNRLIDGAAHRRELPAVYNAYARVRAEPTYEPSMDDERMLLYPLYATSFCLCDFLQDNDYFGATQIIIASASSKTAIGIAYGLSADPGSPASVGLTSTGNRERVISLDLYGAVSTYAALDTIDARLPTVIVDMSGNGQVLSQLHHHLGDNMRFTSNVGLTHYADNAMGPHFIRERSAFFFAPDHIKKRVQDWGPGEFEKRAYAFWYDASLRSRDWLVIEGHEGVAQLTRAYDQVLSGKVPPHKGIVVSP